MNRQEAYSVKVLNRSKNVRFGQFVEKISVMATIIVMGALNKQRIFAAEGQDKAFFVILISDHPLLYKGANFNWGVSADSPIVQTCTIQPHISSF